VNTQALIFMSNVDPVPEYVCLVREHYLFSRVAFFI